MKMLALFLAFWVWWGIGFWGGWEVRGGACLPPNSGFRLSKACVDRFSEMAEFRPTTWTSAECGSIFFDWESFKKGEGK
jgi:hypothetical protein